VYLLCANHSFKDGQRQLLDVEHLLCIAPSYCLALHKCLLITLTIFRYDIIICQMPGFPASISPPTNFYCVYLHLCEMGSFCDFTLTTSYCVSSVCGCHSLTTLQKHLRLNVELSLCLENMAAAPTSLISSSSPSSSSLSAASSWTHPLKAARQLRDSHAPIADTIAAFQIALKHITSMSPSPPLLSTTGTKLTKTMESKTTSSSDTAAVQANDYDSDDDDIIHQMQQSECWFEIGRLHSSIGDHKAAIVSFTNAHKADPSDMSTLLNLANHYIALELYDDALRTLDMVLATNATKQQTLSHARAWCIKGTCLAAMEQLDDAIAACQQSISLDEKDVRTWRHMASLLDDNGQTDESIAAYKRTIQLKPDDTVSIFNLSTVLLSNGHVDDAVKYLDTYTRMAPDDSEGWSSLATSYVALDKKELALNAFDQWIRLSPDCSEAYGSRGNLLDCMGRRSDALSSFDRSLELSGGDDSLIWRSRGICLFAMNRRPQSLESYQRAAAIEPNDVATWVNMACVLASLQRRDEALTCYDRALTIVPNDWQVLRNKGGLLVRMDRLIEAKACWNLALQYQPDDQRTKINLKNLTNAMLAEHEHPINAS
jgi:tetratricopeptide (TPR) repeat protein